MNALTESKEDYLEAILVIGLEKKWVRVRDLAKYLGVKPSSVAAAVKSLAEKGLVSHEKYGYVELAKDGVAIARQIYACHKTLYKFLHDLLGLSKSCCFSRGLQNRAYSRCKNNEALIKIYRICGNLP